MPKNLPGFPPLEETMCSDAEKLDDKAISTATLAKIYPSEKDRLGGGPRWSAVDYGSMMSMAVGSTQFTGDDDI